MRKQNNTFLNRKLSLLIIFSVLFTVVTLSSADVQSIPTVIQKQSVSAHAGVSSAVSGVVRPPAVESVPRPSIASLADTSTGFDIQNNETFNNTLATTGVYIGKWGKFGSGNGRFSIPNGIAVASNKRVYVSDTGNFRIQVFDSNGKFIRKWGSWGTGNSRFNEAQGIAISPDGKRVYVADTSNHRIQVFDPNGRFITKWGTSGSAIKHFWFPVDIDIAPNGRVYVVDQNNYRIQVFDPNGRFITKWGKFGNGKGEFFYPNGIALSPDGKKVYVADLNNGRIQIFYPNGKYLSQWVTPYPWRVAVGPDGRVYVSDMPQNRIMVYTPEGKYITGWGESGTGNGQFNLPYGVAFSPDGKKVYVADKENHRIQIFKS